MSPPSYTSNALGLFYDLISLVAVIGFESDIRLIQRTELLGERTGKDLQYMTATFLKLIFYFIASLSVGATMVPKVGWELRQ